MRLSVHSPGIDFLASAPVIVAIGGLSASVAPSGSRWWGAIVGWLVAGLVTARLVRRHVVVDDEGVTVVNLIRRRRLGYSSIDLCYGTWRGVVFRLTDGRRVTATGVPRVAFRWIPPYDRANETTVLAVNAHLHRLRSKG